MSSVETYKKSMEIEFFLRNNLNLKPGSRTDRNLKDYYQSIVWYEEGKMRMPLSQFRKHFERLLKHFEKVIDKKTNSTNRMRAQQINLNSASLSNPCVLTS